MRVVLGKRGDYAIRAILDVAGHCDQRRKAREIAEDMEIPQKFLSRILADLVRAGVLGATAGPTGGYQLIAPPERVTLLEVIEAVEGPATARDCLLRSMPCNADSPCQVHDAWVTAEGAMLDSLRATTFAHLGTSGDACPR